MYNLIDAKLLVLPDWLDKALQAHRLKPKDILTKEGLESILSAPDVEYYHKQVEQLITVVKSGNGDSALSVVLDSLSLLHTNSGSYNHLGNAASGINENVKINALYGKRQPGYDFFNGANMLGYIPRTLASSLEKTVQVYPYIERFSADLFVLRFSLEAYDESRKEEQFIENSLRLFMSEYGFDKLSTTKLFDYRTLMIAK